MAFDPEPDDIYEFNLNLDDEFDLAGEILRLSVSEQLEHYNGSMENVKSFSRQARKSGIRICDQEDVEILNHGNPLGAGTTLTVFKGRLKPHGDVVAVKRLNLERAMGQSSLTMHDRNYYNMLESLILELRVMMHPWFLSHPNIVDLVAIFWEYEQNHGIGQVSDARPVMVVELADETFPTLNVAIETKTLSEPERFRVLEDVAEALTVIHGAKMIHGDIKPENILLFKRDDRYVAKVSDFGFSNPYREDVRPIGGTTYWNAPVRFVQVLDVLKLSLTSLHRSAYLILQWSSSHMLQQ